MSDPSSGARPPYPIRSAAPDEIRHFLSPMGPAFGEEYGDAEFEAERPILEPERIIAAFDGDEPVGCAGALSRRLTIPGGTVAPAAVTLVGVKPSHRRQGILRSLMLHQLADVVGRGEPVAILWASEGSIYQRFGYGPGTVQGRIEVERAHARLLRPVRRPGRIRLVEADEALRTFPAIHDAVEVATPGMIDRSPAWWKHLGLSDLPAWRDGAGPRALALHETDGVPDGYAMYRVKSDWEPRGARNRLIVGEVLSADPAVERALWAWLLDLDLVGTIQAGRQPLPHPLQLMVADPRRLGLLVGDGLWLRLVDVPAALAARSYAEAGSLVIELTDATLPDNAGRWRISASADDDGASRPDGSAADIRAVIARSDGEPDLRLDVADLAAVYLGAFRFADLARAGRVVEARPGTLARADRLFASTVPACCSTMF
jgi:predicted acetyltransferase